MSSLVPNLFIFANLIDFEWHVIIVWTYIYIFIMGEIKNIFLLFTFAFIFFNFYLLNYVKFL